METVVIKRDWREYKYLDAVAPEDFIIAKAQPPVKEKKQKPKQQNNSESESESKSSQSESKEGKSKQNTSESKENKNEEKTEQTQGESESQENKNEYKPDIHQGNKEANIEAETKKSDKEKQHESNISEKGKENKKENNKKETPEIGDTVIFPAQNGEKKKYRLIAIDKNKFDCTIQDSKGDKSATRLNYLQKEDGNNAVDSKEKKEFKTESKEQKEAVSDAFKMPPLSSVSHLHQQKVIQVNQSFDFEKSKQNRVKSALARIISTIAEDETNLAVEGNDVINMNLLLQRKITRNPVSQCMQGLERERVAIFLDTSGSCYALSKLYAGILQSAFKDDNVELYEVPNAKFEKEWNGKEWVRTNMDWGNFRGRTILYFGDFDGADENIIPNSRYNKIFWLFYERYYTWISTEEIKSRQTMFRGKIIPCSTEEQFVGAIKKIH